ncbi:helix-turn-helix domain-containing protein [Streptomyces sp. NRRL B-1677]|uniref:helix-turn-helix domain-containing protein n=1 Tax=Streptomyces sp. NRRL B-1677 TaxID=2682966 RepID=UPI001892C0B4|nr:helix-turn-helix transcriptional regulator [Streptomyces sp. NRRL B-1677]MBF6048322.1 helix-turn-helix domain-containing protein [Streptomyces sp. NRRL B-1677]
MGSDVGAGDLAELLRALKERSGLSYGVLAKRLHVSTSTLHRYCSGTAVPAEFAPVERLARLCKATPEELMEVHRRWIVADATRGRKQQAEPAAKAEGAAEDSAAKDSVAKVEPAAGEPVAQDAAEARKEPEVPVVPSMAPSDEPTAPQRRRLSRKTLLAALAAAAAVTVLGSAALAVTLGGGDGKGGGSGPGDDGKGRIVGAAPSAKGRAPEPGKPGTEGSSSPSAEPSPSQSRGEESGRPGASASPGGSPEPETGGGTGPDKNTGVPLTAHVRPYAYEDPCTQHFLVDRSPGTVPVPPGEPDAPGWVAELGAVPAGEQFIKITLQGTGKETVVLEGLQVRVQDTKPPLAWNEYRTGVGCGGDVATRSFGVDLDSARPVAAPRAGQRDFPYKVSETDPEVFYVKAAAQRQDVTWYLEVQWSSGGRRGVLRIDDQGRPFRTSGAAGRPSYQWPPGSPRWEPAPQEG